jgi:hypothetical protein
MSQAEHTHARSWTRRLMLLMLVLAVIGSLFAALVWPRALLALAGLNAVASVVFLLGRRMLTATLSAATCGLILATLFLTDWGLSSLHPVIRIAWPYLIGASIAEVATISSWMVSIRPREQRMVST